MRLRSAALLAVFFLPSLLFGQETHITGRVVDPKGDALAGATVRLMNYDQVLAETNSSANGDFQLAHSQAGQFTIRVDANGFRSVLQPITVRPSASPQVLIVVRQLAVETQTVTVMANVSESDVLSPDPAQKVFVSQDLLDANPGRPGAPVSIPGYPIETASSGIKAPQYFAPGVAGDHGEPIAQYIAVGNYLLPNNLSANAHGNGYADPNIFVPEVLESVEVDGGAFNVREGNHSLNLAATYGLRSSFAPFLTITGDYRDIDAVVGFSPSSNSWLAISGSYGNGFLDRLEHRQQYKFNGERFFHPGNHQITLFGIAYYGFSYVPGLVPIMASNSADANSPNYGDTIDPRQKDQTHTALLAVNDNWQLSTNQQLQLSAFFRTYNLSLFSNFGQGLIRQSEFRTVAGSTANYTNRISNALSFLLGLEYDREAPRRDNLDHYNFFDPSNPGYYGPFTPVDSNNITISTFASYIAAQGALRRYFRYYLGWRRDEINIHNVDLLFPDHSFNNWVGVNSPKATIAFLPKDSWFVPALSLSFGQAFFTNDPRIGTGTTPPSPINTAHSYQLVASKTVHKTDLRLTLGHVTTSQTLAQLDPDTGLQVDQGPGRVRYLSFAVSRNFSRGSLLATFSKADALDVDTGLPAPEAPRTIFDLLGTIQKLPVHLEAKGEFEYVGIKPLGTGCFPHPNVECTGTPVKEFRAAVIRPFQDGRFILVVNLLLASGYTGQTIENFYPSELNEVVGVRIPSYASVTIVYRFRGRGSP